MKYILSIFFPIIITNLTFGQIESNTVQIENDSVKIIHDTYEDLEDLERKKEELGIEQLTYIDSTFKFKIAIPEWYKVMETGTPYAFGGILPEVQGIENAIAIKSYDKKGNSFEEFEEYIVKHMVLGQTVNWSKSHTSMGKKELDEFNEVGKSYKVYLLINNLLYHCQYVLTESETAFLWIDYTATEDTFDKNKGKFEEFMKGFEILK